MLRKQFRKSAGGLLLAALLLGPALGQAQSAATASTRLSAQMWAATARYVYHDDPDLRPIVSQLDLTVQEASVPAFNTGLAQAVALERPLKHENLKKFQGLVGELQGQKLTSMALADAIINRLDDNKQRMADPARKQGLDQLKQQLNMLATETAPATGVVAGSAADNPMNQVATVPAEQDLAPMAPAAPVAVPVAVPVAAAGGAPAWESWLALALSGLSFLGMMLLFRKLNRFETLAAPITPTAEPAPTSRKTSRQEPNVSWEEMRKYVERQMDERLSDAGLPPLVTAAALVASVPVAAMPAVPVAALPDELEAAFTPLPVAPAGPRLRTQYVSGGPFNNAFQARYLSDQLGTYSTYAIVSNEQQSQQGTFTVVSELVSNVRDHRSVFEPVCEYIGDYPLGGETRVITVEPGLVRRRGDDWEVVQRAKVRFE